MTPLFDILSHLRSFIEEHLEAVVVAEVLESRRKQAGDQVEGVVGAAQESTPLVVVDQPLPLRLEDIKLGIKSR
jgi:hypothetical protein